MFIFNKKRGHLLFTSLLMLAIGSLLSDAHLVSFAQVAPGLKPGDYKTVWDGVYNETQAARGYGEYETNCMGCHTVDVDPMNPDARIVGPGFLSRWREYDVESLFSFIKASMPRRDPGTLSDQSYLDIVAHLLESNLFPTGDGELTLKVMEYIQIEEKEGPRPVPTGTLVQLVGCLGQDGSEWVLTSASEPVRTDSSNGSTVKELEHALVRNLGDQTFWLQNVDYLGVDFGIDSHEGQKM